MALDLKKKKISVIGAGRSGIAAAAVSKRLGAIPFVSDNGDYIESSASLLKQEGIAFEFGGHSSKAQDCDLMIVSPGVPSDSDVIRSARSLGLTVWPEIELAYRIFGGTIIGVTGSNGKTTTTALIGEILRRAGREVRVCGNIGNPFVGIAAEMSADGIAVVELSSFQLEMIDQFRADIAVFLNITPDHLDRHGDFNSYFEAKLRIFENQRPTDIAVVNYDDDNLRSSKDRVRSKTSWFSTLIDLPGGVTGRPNGDLAAFGENIIASGRLKIKGMHNLSNACAACAAALGAGVTANSIAEGLESFPGVEHRLEPVRLIGGVSFINDSKGTNVDSVKWALKAVSTPVILIAGGKDKDGDFSVLNELILEKVKAVVLIGRAAGKIRKTWGNFTECVDASDMSDAVHRAFSMAAAGDTVLLSPGCASFDMYENFEHRGRVFKEEVEKLYSSEVAG